MFRKYFKGWQPRADRNASKYKSTIRDTGRGSSKFSDYSPRSPDQVPTTYEEIKAACLESGELWEDPDFPTCDESLYYENPPSAPGDIEWLRASEIHDDPQMFVDGACRLDINQGVLGDCWLLAAVSCLATHPRLLKRVVPEDQSFQEDYAGVFRFEIWQFGRWVEVCIDDRLPTCNGKLIYMHSDNTNEFWSAMLEKAYAKLCGCYESLSGGLTSEALTDFTGGIAEKFELRENAPEDLFKIMAKAHSKRNLLGCSIDATPDSMEAQLDNGLIIGHAYSVTDVRYVEVETPRVSGRIPMVRVRNPWGDSHEWKGAWSDDSEEWTLVPEEEKEEMGLTYSHDGEFWMAYKDWVENFQRLEIVYLGPDTLLEDDEGDEWDAVRKWEGHLMEGSWRKRVNAGGCRNFPKTFWTNPQYRVSIPEEDDDDDEGLGGIIVALMQKDRRKMKKIGQDNNTIGYAIYGLEDPECGPLDYSYFQTHASDARSPSYINMREISDHHKLPPGHYVIVPTTFDPDTEGDFILRVFSEKPDETEEIGEDDEDDEAKGEEGRDAFLNLAGEDGEIDAYELKDILNNLFMQEFEFDGFSADMCRSMVAMRDADMSGKLGFQDFKNLWYDLQLCRKVFKMLDEDGGGFFSSYELRRAINAIAHVPGCNLTGLRVSNSTFNAIVMRYSNKEGQVRFDDFVACVIKLRTMFETFKGKDEAGEGQATFDMDEYVQLAVYS
ncbi:hypothetical protein CAPTEDRAFT_167979 [Capitella teleta]|uniref:Calpain catalytic domain-containing protein n=1 Tax=Capitella teleta TaxID=283909 RepID=R7ULX9_CAPTE|nr:hypothetical protein CAPTEDRAFT_167979 [Capitella teleta]|eukprot:ELU07534.1 hypothetical protein CAPTEDRAFT_167979 [Capitella teleta]